MALQKWMVLELDLQRQHEQPKENIAYARKQLEDSWPHVSNDFQFDIIGAIDDLYASENTYWKAVERVDALNPLDEYPDFASVPKTTLPEYVDSYKAFTSQLEARMPVVRRLADLLRGEEGVTGETFLRKEMDQVYKDHVRDLTSYNTALKSLREQLHRRRLDQLSEKRREYSFSDSWVGTWHLGAGSFGKASLWVQQDRAGQIIDRVVVKESNFARKDQELWDNKNSYLWTRSNEGDPPMPVEVAAHLLLSTKLGAECVVQLRTWNISHELYTHRMYLEFCPHGDAFELMKTYRQKPLEMPGFHAYIPEAFIWSVFENLALACLLMEHKDPEREDGDWTLICHRDCKLSNVFLGTSLLSRYSGYPAGKLADFGLAALVRSNETRTAGYFETVGTPKNRPPESLIPAFPHSSANIWGVGNIIWSLMELEEGDGNLCYDRSGHEMDADEDPDSPELGYEPTFSQLAGKIYNDELRTAVRWCVRSDPSLRPSAEALWNHIQTFLQKGGPVAGPISHLRAASKDEPRFQNLFIREDKWQMYSKLTAPPDGFLEVPQFPENAGDQTFVQPGGPPGQALGNDGSSQAPGGNSAALQSTRRIGLDSRQQSVQPRPRISSAMRTASSAARPGASGSSGAKRSAEDAAQFSGAKRTRS